MENISTDFLRGQYQPYQHRFPWVHSNDLETPLGAYGPDLWDCSSDVIDQTNYYEGMLYLCPSDLSFINGHTQIFDWFIDRGIHIKVAPWAIYRLGLENNVTVLKKFPGRMYHDVSIGGVLMDIGRVKGYNDPSRDNRTKDYYDDPSRDNRTKDYYNDLLKWVSEDLGFFYQYLLRKRYRQDLS